MRYRLLFEKRWFTVFHLSECTVQFVHINDTELRAIVASVGDSNHI